MKTIALLALCFALPAAAHAKTGDSSAAVAFTKQPLREWWEKLPEPEQKAFLKKAPILALSFELHRKVMPMAPAGVVTDRSLRDWWDGLNELQRQSTLKEHPALRDAFASWRKKIDAWTSKERKR